MSAPEVGGSLARASHLRLVQTVGERAADDTLIEEARALDRLGKRAEARALYDQALRAVPAPSRSLESTLLRWIARSHEIDGSYDAANEFALAAVAAAEQGDDRNALGHALNVLAVARWRQGHLDQAERLFQEALQRGTSTTDPRLQVDVATNLGALAMIRGDFREALRHYQDALAQGRVHSLLDNVVVTLEGLGLANMALARYDAAQTALSEALTIADALGGLSFRIQLEVDCASLQVERQDFEEATRCCDRAMALAAHLDDPRANGEAAKVYGVIARETGDLVRAEAQLLRAHELALAAHDILLEGDVNRELAELFSRLGRSRDMLQALSRAHRCFTQLRARHELADVGRRMNALESQFLEVVRRWGESIESKDVHTQGHCERVAHAATLLAERAGLDATSLFWFRIGALLHDVGKLIIPAEVLNKEGKLSPEEWDLMRQHPAMGEQMLAEIEFPWDVAPMIRSHHERWDGTGYPDRLATTQIAESARILCIADVYDALTSPRSYKRAFSPLEAIEIMRRGAGTQFDPRLFSLFDDLMRSGALVVAPANTVGAPVSAGGPAQPALQHVLADARPPVPARRRGGLAEDDDLTGALTRRAFIELTEAVMAERRRTNAAVSLLVIDVDEFKRVNDTFGHLGGDAALKFVTGIIRDLLRPGQYVGRYAGDEFLVLLPGHDVVRASELASSICRTAASLPAPVGSVAGTTTTLTLSIGVAAAPTDGDTFEKLFLAADKALFDAKRDGRNKVVRAGAAVKREPDLVFSRFVGRSQEMRSLVQGLESSVRDGTHVRVVLGEAGVGKSTLVRQLLPEIRLRDGVMVTGRALEAERRPPYAPWIEVVQAIHSLGLVESRTWPMLAELVPAVSVDQTADAPRTSPDAALGHRLQQELTAYLREASETRPLTIVLEDVHWADAASWDALEVILARLEHERIFFALTMRSEEATTPVMRERRQRMSRNERSSDLRLERLTAVEVREWLQGALHTSSGASDLLEFVLRHTEGNPFLITQLLRCMKEEGVFTYRMGDWTWTIPTALTLPSGMSDLVGRRLNRLSPAALSILVTGAVIGRSFDLHLLAAAADITVDAALNAVEAGLAASVLEALGGQDDGYQFAHALLVDAVLATASPSRRRLQHERVGDVLAIRTPVELDQIALHYARGSDRGKAYSWCRRAAARALQLFALDEAVEFLRCALASATTDDERADVHDRLAHAAEQSGRWAEVEVECDAILALRTRAGGVDAMIPVQRRRLQARLRLGYQGEEIERECRLLLGTATARGNPAEIVQVNLLLVQALIRAGATTAAVELARQSLVIAEQHGDPSVTLDVLHRLGISLLATGDPEVVTVLLELVDRSRAAANRVMEARAFLTLGVARTRHRDELGAAAAFADARTLGREVQAIDVAANAALNLGVISLRAGAFGEARSAFDDALRLYTMLRNNANRLAALYNLANLERERGAAVLAQTLYSETIELARASGADDIGIGAIAGSGLAALQQRDTTRAFLALDAAVDLLGTRVDWWFQGRELFESLVVQLDSAGGRFTTARTRLETAIARLEPVDPYAAAWLIADCVAPVAVNQPSLWDTVERFGALPTVQQYLPLAARFTALQDLADRAPGMGGTPA